jgi:threonine dehydratase
MIALEDIRAAGRAIIPFIFHERHQKGIPLYVSRVHIELETRNPDHIDEVTSVLEKAGYAVDL